MLVYKFIEMEDNNYGGEWSQLGFQGNAGEYFGIWIGNILLTIITLGIYSAWAKVRTATYFANKTVISETPLAYHATGLQILKGRVIALFVISFIPLVSWLGDTHLFDGFSIIVSIGVLAIIPFVINNSIKFNLRMTSYRNIRFNFSGRYWPTFFYVFLSPILIILSLGLAFPYITAKSHKYFVSNYKFGSKEFISLLSSTAYYKPFFVISIKLLLIGIPLAFITVVADGWVVELVAFAILMYYYISYYAQTHNLLINSIQLDDVSEFKSAIEPWALFWLFLTNILAIVFSLGLAIPWATVRQKKFFYDNYYYKLKGNLDAVIDTEKNKLSSISEGLSDLDSDFGFDVPI